MHAPQPADLPLPLPLPAGLLALLLIVFFAAHILFVNLMLGGSLLTLAYEWLGRKRPDCDALAREIAATITVNKSLAVVLGVGPLLCINLLYTVPFYSANRATGDAWMLIVPLVIAAFLLAYLHKYSWERLQAHKAIHLAIGAMASALLLGIPLIFLANINLMLFPEHWTMVQQRGFWAAVALPNVLPRYLHFLLASFAATALFLVWYLTRPGYPLAQRLPGATRAALRRRFYTIALIATLAQLLAGPLVLFTLPTAGLSPLMLGHILGGAGLALLVLWWLWREIERASDAERLGPGFWRIVIGFSLVVLLMATGRHLYRAQALQPFQAQIAAKSAERQQLAAHYRAHPQRPEEEDPLAALPGYQAFATSCRACHAVDQPLVGPSLRAIAQHYTGPQAIAELMRWTRTVQQPKLPRDPARSATMPAFSPAQIDDATLRSIAEFMLEAGRQP